MTNDPVDIPMVSATSLGTIVLELNPADAETLARILAHYDALVANASTYTEHIGYEADLWHHTMIRLLSERARIGGNVAATIDVPLLPALHLVGGGRA